MSETSPENKLTSTKIKLLLSQKFCAPAFAFFTEVGNATGFENMRYADAISYSLYQSAGLEMVGYEIKTSRADFLNEMKHPEKAEAIMQFCDRWYLVCPKGMITKDELPITWGLLEVSCDKIYKKKPAPKLENKPISRKFLAALLRRASEDVIPKSIYEEKYFEAQKRIRAELEAKYTGTKEETTDESYFERRYNQLKSKVDEFEKVSGVIIDTYTGNEMGQAVRIVKNYLSNAPYNFQQICQRADLIKQQAEELKTLFSPNLLTPNKMVDKLSLCCNAQINFTIVNDNENYFCSECAKEISLQSF